MFNYLKICNPLLFLACVSTFCMKTTGPKLRTSTKCISGATNKNSCCRGLALPDARTPVPYIFLTVHIREYK